MFIPTMKKLESQFVHYGEAFPDSPLPICERFELIYKHVPELARVSLSSDLTPLFHLALHEWEGQRLFCMIDAARLRYHLYDQIYRNHGCFEHTLVYEQSVCEMWANLLMTKAQAMRPTRRQDGRIRKATVPDIPEPTWIH